VYVVGEEKEGEGCDEERQEEVARRGASHQVQPAAKERRECCPGAESNTLATRHTHITHTTHDLSAPDLEHVGGREELAQFEDRRHGAPKIGHLVLVQAPADGKQPLEHWAATTPRDEGRLQKRKEGKGRERTQFFLPW
jgi:hypothetical protein